MILRSIALRDFRRFTALRVAFAPGFNIVVGNNEEGKSTLREAITLALFQDPKTRNKEVLAQQRWGAPGQFALRLALEVDGRGYIMDKDFQTKTAVLEEAGSGERVQDAKAIESRIAAMVGLPSREVFESTVRVGQRDVTQLKARRQMADSLQQLVTGGEQDVLASRVIEEIDRALTRLKTAARDNPGPLTILPPKIASLAARADAVRASVDEAARAHAALLGKQRELEAGEEALALKRRQQAGCAKRLGVEAELRSARAEEARLDARVDQARGIHDQIAAIERTLAEGQGIASVDPEQLAEVASLEQAIADTSEPTAKQSEGASRRPRFALLLAGAALLAAGLVTHLAISVVGLAVIAFELWRTWSSAAAQRLAGQMRAGERREAADKASRRLAEVLSAAGCASAAELRERYRATRELLVRRGMEEARLQGLLAGERLDDIAEQRRAASRRARGLEEALAEPELALAQLDQAGYQRLVKDVEAMQRTCKDLETQVVHLRVTIASARSSLADLHAMEEELQELRDQLAATERRRDVLSLTKRVMEEARTATLSAAKDVLNEELGKLIAEITGGRYDRVAVDDQLGIQVIAPESGAPVDVALEGELSTGTVEQVYVAARLAIARLLAQGRHPPLILDDPFLSFDEGRTNAVLDLCRRLSAEHQVLLFTTRSDYAALGDHVIRLPGI